MTHFIERYTEKNEVVLDPFLGSGVSITEAVMNDRAGVGIDINPSAVFIANQILSTVDIDELISEFEALKASVKTEIDSYYKVVRDGEEGIGLNFLWEGGKMTEVRYDNGGKKRVSVSPKKSDIELAKSFKKEDIKDFYPTKTFFHNSRINANREKQVCDLFTNRNLKALALLNKKINEIENIQIRNLMLFAFTSSMGQASKMVFVIKRRNKTKNAEAKVKKEVGSWVIGYWAPKDFFENNAWTCYETRFKKILKAKKETSKEFNLSKKQLLEEIQKGGDYLLIKKPAQDYLKSIPDNSIDYILTDPPHGNRIPYLELSLLWNSWLKHEVDYSSEIIISESKDRSKKIEEYNLLMKEVIGECYRVLKPSKRLSFMFNSLDDSAWKNVVETFYYSGFELEHVETLNYSANSVVQDNRKNGLQTDFIITYIKNNKQQKSESLEMVDLYNEADIFGMIKYLKSEQLKAYEIMNEVLIKLLSKGQFFSVSQLIKILEE